MFIVQSRLEVSRLRMLVRQMTQFVTIRQFPPADRSLPPLSKSKWWIPAAARVLALISNSTTNFTNSLRLMF